MIPLGFAFSMGFWRHFDVITTGIHRVDRFLKHSPLSNLSVHISSFRYLEMALWGFSKSLDVIILYSLASPHLVVSDP
jgi:hypothetical protein